MKRLRYIPLLAIMLIAWMVPQSAYAAIAFDNATRNAAITTTTVTFNHTATGSNLNVILYFYDNSNGVAHTVTYGGVTMTQVVKQQLAGTLYLWGFFLGSGVPTGSQTVSITTGSSQNYGAVSVGSYTGASQASATTPDSSNSLIETASGNRSVSTTVVAANSWLVAGHVDNDADPDATIAPAVERTQLSGPSDIIDTNGTVGTGSQSIGWHWAVSDQHALGVMSIAPAIAAPASAMANDTSQGWWEVFN